MRKLLLPLLLFPCANLAASLTPFTATYGVTVHGIPAGKITRQLALREGHYTFTSEMDATIPFVSFHISETSKGKWTASGPKPEQYTYHLQNYSKEHYWQTTFDWQKNIATTQRDGDRHYAVKLTPDAQDKLSYQLALRNNLSNKTNLMSYHIVDKGDMDVYTFKQTGTENIRTVLGHLNTIKMERTNTQDANDILFWLAPTKSYVIARILDNDDSSMPAAGILKTYKNS